MANSRASEYDFDAKAAGEDLSSSLMYLANLDSSGNFVLAGAGEFVWGAITEGGTSGNSSTVQTGGIAKVSAGAAVSIGDKVASDASGQGIPWTTGHWLGYARSAAANADEIIEVLVDRGYHV